MTDQEAIKWIDGRIRELCGSVLDGAAKNEKLIKVIDKEGAALLKARKALYKSIPAMVTHQATLRQCCTCPSCLNVVDEFTEFVTGQKIRVQVQWCRYCGQALKWED